MSELVFACLGRFLDYKVHPEAPGQTALLQGYSLRFNKSSDDGSGKANVEPHEGGVVWGVLYSIPDAELQILSAGEGGYVPRRMPVISASEQVEAWVYVSDKASDDVSLRPYSWYKRFVVEGARSHGLPPDYIVALEAIDAGDDAKRERDRQKRSLPCDDEAASGRPFIAQPANSRPTVK